MRDDAATSSTADGSLDHNAQTACDDVSTASAAVGNDIQNRFADCGGAAAGPPRAPQSIVLPVVADGVGNVGLPSACAIVEGIHGVATSSAAHARLDDNAQTV